MLVNVYVKNMVLHRHMCIVFLLIRLTAILKLLLSRMANIPKTLLLISYSRQEYNTHLMMKDLISA